MGLSSCISMKRMWSDIDWFKKLSRPMIVISRFAVMLRTGALAHHRSRPLHPLARPLQTPALQSDLGPIPLMAVYLRVRLKRCRHHKSTWPI